MFHILLHHQSDEGRYDFFHHAFSGQMGCNARLFGKYPHEPKNQQVECLLQAVQPDPDLLHLEIFYPKIIKIRDYAPF